MRASRIALIDYGAGNLTSVKKALAAIGAEIFVPVAPQELADVAAIIVPGVGHFGSTRALDRPWVDGVRAHLKKGRSLLGICLGLQWLFEGSEEAPECPGLGLLPGRCYRLGSRDVARPPEAAGAGTIKIPHVGWNTLEPRHAAAITEGVPSGAQVYFTHSFVAPIVDATVAVTDHGEPFSAIVEHEQVAGVQFHPEKSGDVGLHILRNWLARV